MYTDADIDVANLKSAAIGLIETAEFLFAEHGIHAVSTREIAREAGQKNHSAVAYHFGGKDQLLTAIVTYRSPPINKQRAVLLETLLAKGQQKDTRALVSALFLPWVAMLFQQSETNNYIGFIGQLSARQFDALLSYSPADHTGCIRTIGELMAGSMGELPVKVIRERQALLGTLSTRAVATWDARRRMGDPDYADDQLQWRIDHMIDYICAGLTAPFTEETAGLTASSIAESMIEDSAAPNKRDS